MKTILLSIFFKIISCTYIFSQNDTIDILYNKNNIRLSDFYEYSGGKEYTFSSDKYVYIVKLVKRQIEIYRFDTEGNEINKTEPIDALNSKDIKVLTITKFGANYIVLYIKNNESGDNARRFNSLHYRQIDLETGDIGEEQLLDKMKVRSYDRYEFCFSVDNSFLMVYYYMNNESTSSKRVKCIIYQDDFEIFETEEIQIPYDELNESIEHVFVTNYATPYWVIKNEEKKEHKFFILKLSSQTAEEYKPEELAKWGSLYTYFNTKDQVDLVGTYDKGKQIFVQNLKKRSDLTVVNLPLNIYPNTVTNQHFRELLLLEAKPCKDEGRLIVTQEHCKKVVRERGGADGMQYYDRIKEYLRNMILVRLDKDKKIKWIANIPQQEKVNGVDFRYFFINDQHYFFTIENEKEDGSLSIPPSENLDKEKFKSYYEKNKVKVVKLFIVDDASGQYRVFNLFNADYQAGYKISNLNLKNLVVTNDIISIEAYLGDSNKTMLSLPLQK